MTIPERETQGSGIVETPLEAIEGMIDERVRVEDREFVISRPEKSDALLDHPAVRARFGSGEYLPYWVDLWPSARMLSKAILREQWTAGTRALEIGCGLGLPGIAALSAGLRVTFSDCDRTALHFAGHNARANGLADFDLLPLDWNHPPSGLSFALVFGSDLIYEARNVAPLVELIGQVLAPAGECLITDQDRIPADLLRRTLVAHGMQFTTKVMHAGEPGGRRSRGTLYRIVRTRTGLDPSERVG